MSGINKVILLGTLGKDPEIRYSPSGMAIVNISVATSYKPKDGEEKVEWHRLVALDRTAEVIAEYMRKGDMHYFEGRLQTRKWTDKDGVERYSTEVVVEKFAFAKSKGGDKAEGGDPAAPAQKTNAERKSKPSTGTGFDDMDDDIPF